LPVFLVWLKEDFFLKAGNFPPENIIKFKYMKLQKKYPILASSANPENLSLTLKGASVLLLLYVLRQAGVEISENEVLTLITLLTGIISSLMTVIGLLRKVYYRMK